MLTRITGVIGANFGDEGKGLMTDYFVHKHLKDGKSCIVIKHNGGSQAGHTVVTPNGKRHVFGHFGSGTLQGVPTYFDKDFIINPMTFVKEYKQLEKLGCPPVCYVHPECRIQLPTDVLINQIAESYRGDKRHGSCGMGIWETVVRSEKPHMMFNVKMFQEVSASEYHKTFRDFLHYVFNPEQYLIDRLQELKIPVTEENKKLCCNENLWNNYEDDLYFLFSKCIIMTPSEVVQEWDSAVFETGQGLLLDESNEQFTPYLTPSKTGAHNIMRFIRENLVGVVNNVNIELCYVSRSYMTRHGAGFFPTECDKHYLFSNPQKIVDSTNKTNEYQGSLRYGRLDVPNVLGRIMQDFTQYAFLAPTWSVNWTMAITHMDETNNKIPSEVAGEFTKLLRVADVNRVYVSVGNTRDFISKKGYIKFSKIS